MSSSFAQGKKLLENLQNKIKEGFSLNRREGFSGILGSNAAMDSVLASDQLTTKTVDASYNKNIKTYSDSYSALQSRTELYLNDPANNGDLQKNYNIFINKSLNQDKISETSLNGCVNFAALDSNKIPKDSKFNTAYPANFTNYSDAENACKLWAADSNSTTYGLAQDSASKFNCYHSSSTIDLTKLAVYTKPKILYSILLGDATTTQGGLFKNGQIGVWSGEKINPVWNIPNMKVPTIIKKYNSRDYTTGPAGLAAAITGNWWGVPIGTDGNWNKNNGWGYNFWPNNSTAWWITSTDYNVVGTMGYFYYVYDNAGEERYIFIYIVVDDKHVLKVNGTVATEAWNYGFRRGTIYVVPLVVGKNVFEVELINTYRGGPGAFVLYAAEISNYLNVLFTSDSASTPAAAAAAATAAAAAATAAASTTVATSTAAASTATASATLAYGWGYSSTPVTDYKIVNNISSNSAYPLGTKTLNAIPNDYTKCNLFYGGGINNNSITASYGRNCSNVANPPLNVRYVIIQANSKGDCIQIAQLAVNAIVKGALLNVMALDVAIHASSDWGWGSNKYWPKDGKLAPRNFPYIFHSGCKKGDIYMVDLKQEFAVVQIVFYNRSDCCTERAKGMRLYVYNGNGSYLNGATFLSGALIQKFGVSTAGIVNT